jgi:hypothetical protein
MTKLRNRVATERGTSLPAAALTLVALGLGGCASAQGGPVERVDAIQASAEVPEAELLDVGIEVFADGVDPEWDQAILNEKGVFPDIRKAEGRYFAILLKRTLESTGHWGAVRVVPKLAEGVDLTISGEIVESNGKRLAIRVLAVDARGREWLDREYKAEADTLAYVMHQERAQAARRGESSPAAAGKQLDPYQSLYNRIANDLLDERRDIDTGEVHEIRRTSELRFAADLAPQAFSSHLSRDGKGRYGVERLPAEGDPMLARVARIRQRDYFFVDTLNDHYANFFERMDPPYDEWRLYSFEEQLALDEIRRKSKLHKILGGVLAVGGLILGDGDSYGESTIKDAAVIGGVALIADGVRRGREAAIHEAALMELATSLEGDVEPMLIDVEGRTLRLSGSAETQFETWRLLLREAFESETGLPVDPNTGRPVPVASTPEG